MFCKIYEISVESGPPQLLHIVVSVLILGYTNLLKQHSIQKLETSFVLYMFVVENRVVAGTKICLGTLHARGITQYSDIFLQMDRTFS